MNSYKLCENSMNFNLHKPTINDFKEFGKIIRHGTSLNYILEYKNNRYPIMTDNQNIDMHWLYIDGDYYSNTLQHQSIGIDYVDEFKGIIIDNELIIKQCEKIEITTINKYRKEIAYFIQKKCKNINLYFENIINDEKELHHCIFRYIIPLFSYYRYIENECDFIDTSDLITESPIDRLKTLKETLSAYNDYLKAKTNKNVDEAQQFLNCCYDLIRKYYTFWWD